MKKALSIIGILGFLYVFVAYIVPYVIGVPLAAYHSQKLWQEHAQEISQQETVETSLDSLGDFPFPIGAVSDYENLLSHNQIEALTHRIAKYEEATTREIAIVTVSSIAPYDSIDDYATDLGNEWGVGKQDSDDGLVIVVSKAIRQVRISTGLGTERILTDAYCKKVIEEVMIPEFKDNNYGDGIEKGLTALMRIWDTQKSKQNDE